MPARGCDFQRTFGAFLALHIAQIGMALPVFGKAGFRGAQHLHALDVIDECDQRWRRDHAAATGPGCFRPARGRADQPAPRRIGGHRGRQHTGHRRHLCVEGKLAECCVTRHLASRQHAHGGKKAKRDRQIVMAAFLRQIGGRQIDRDAFEGQGKPHRGQCCAHPLPAFAHRLVRQADNVELAIAAIADMNLNIHFARFNALKRNGVDMRNRHSRLPPGRKVRASGNRLPAESCAKSK